MPLFVSDHNSIHIYVFGVVHQYKDVPKDRLATCMTLLADYETPIAQRPVADGNEKYAGRRIRILRRHLLLSQSKLAALTGVPQSNISQIEAGKRVVGKRIAKRLAAVFKTDYRTLL